MGKIRVAFLLNVSENWLGGLNYYRNLITAVVENEDLDIEPVIFLSNDADMKLFKDYPEVTIVKTGLLTRWNLLWFIRKVLSKVFKRDILLEILLRLHKIDIISHMIDILYNVKFPRIGWIADFQHKHIPTLFSKEELCWRDSFFCKLVEKCDSIILSSNSAKNDFVSIYPEFQDKAEVLQFVVSLDKCAMPNRADQLKEKYHIDSKFFYLPNQYWVHKNHTVVLEALNMLNRENKKVLVVSSGHTADIRNKEYFTSIESYINNNNLHDVYYILGKIPYSDVQLLAQGCLSFINPSRFEGWSTTVEEAKTMGKRIVLSNISVHLEQNPQGGVFFNPDNPRELADKMWMLWNADSEKDVQQNDIESNNIKRRRVFVERYKNILEHTLGRFKENKS